MIRAYFIFSPHYTDYTKHFFVSLEDAALTFLFLCSAAGGRFFPQIVSFSLFLPQFFFTLVSLFCSLAVFFLSPHFWSSSFAPYAFFLPRHLHENKCLVWVLGDMGHPRRPGKSDTLIWRKASSWRGKPTPQLFVSYVCIFTHSYNDIKYDGVLTFTPAQQQIKLRFTKKTSVPWVVLIYLSNT